MGVIKKPPFEEALSCDPAGTRTQGPNIKSVVLYQLSYEIDLIPTNKNTLFFGSAKIQFQAL
jgi:hypothetical protein